MTYETTDWEAETKRVIAAFEVVEPCHIVPYVESMCCLAKERTRSAERGIEFLILRSRLYAEIEYQQKFKFFAITESQSRLVSPNIYFIMLSWDGVNLGSGYSKRDGITPSHMVDVLVKALFHLGLLTPEVELGMKVSITAHQKLEWQLEYEAKYGL